MTFAVLLAEGGQKNQQPQLISGLIGFKLLRYQSGIWTNAWKIMQKDPTKPKEQYLRKAFVLEKEKAFVM